jgi:hypothetical protein
VVVFLRSSQLLVRRHDAACLNFYTTEFVYAAQPLARFASGWRSFWLTVRFDNLRVERVSPVSTMHIDPKFSP